MSEMVLIGVVIIVWLAVTVWWLIVLVEALRRPEQDWAAAGQSKVLWIVVMIFLGVLGTILYVFIARPAFART